MTSRPTFIVWLISTIIAITIVLMSYAGITIPVVSAIIAGRHFEFLLGAYILLWLGTIVRGM